jgi:hypothetical protein
LDTIFVCFQLTGHILDETVISQAMSIATEPTTPSQSKHNMPLLSLEDETQRCLQTVITIYSRMVAGPCIEPGTLASPDFFSLNSAGPSNGNATFGRLFKQEDRHVGLMAAADASAKLKRSRSVSVAVMSRAEVARLKKTKVDKPAIGTRSKKAAGKMKEESEED